MLQLKNNTPFSADIAIFPNEDGIDCLYILAKATFKIGKQWTLTEEQPEPVLADEYWGEPEKSSLKEVSDYHLGKSNTDILMTGSAFAPNSSLVSELDVNLRVGQCKKTVRVFGDRQWNNGLISKATPFQSMPLVFERAYGGQHSKDDVVYCEESNPVGIGFCGKRTINELNGLHLPNLEDPNYLISTFQDQPHPACFSASSANWQPRVKFAGTYDEQWQKTCAPYLPKDFDKRFFNTAASELIYQGFLTGGEQVEITNMHPEGALKFALPFVKLKSDVLIDHNINMVALNLETLLLQPNDLTLSMVWKGSLLCDKKVQKINQVTLNLSR